MRFVRPRLLRLAFLAALAAAPAFAAANTAVEPAPQNVPPALWMERHDEFVQIAARGGVDVLFLGDSITDFWRFYIHHGVPRGREVWDREFAPLRAENFGIGADRTQNVLWRIRHGELDGLDPRVIVLMIGTNNLGQKLAGSPNNTPAETVAGVSAILTEIHTQLPDAHILLLGIFPRGRQDDPLRAQVAETNRGLAKLTRLADGRVVRFLDLGQKFLQPDGTLPLSLMPDLLHPNTEGYRIWARELKAPLADLLALPAPQEPSWRDPAPDLSNVRYGPEKRNFLDLWLPPASGRPAPVLVYIHGGGWIYGDKSYVTADYPSQRTDLVRLMLRHGVAVASVNYRYSTMAPLPAPVLDAARAVQYLRSRAREWNLDTSRFAAIGTSAGGCTSLWLAYHADLADPHSTDPVLRQSTRLCAAVGWAAQTSIDPTVIPAWVGDQVLNHPMIARAVGAADRADAVAHYDRYKGLYREYSAYNHVAPGAPPVIVGYGLAPAPGATPGLAIHNMQFGVRLKAKAEAAGDVCIVENRDMPDPAQPKAYDFLLQHLTAAPGGGGGLSANAIHPGLQLWSVRERLKADPAAAVGLIAGYGITEVETADVPEPPGPVLARLLRSRGISAVSAHFGYDHLRRDLPGAIRQAQELGVKYAICSAARPAGGVFDENAARQAAQDFNRWGQAFHQAGIQFGYHPHGIEFGRLRPGSEDTPFDVLVRETNPQWVCYEMDVFWVFHAGQDPVRLLAKYPDRWRLVHLKDIRRGAAVGAQDGHAPVADFVALGTGQIDWPAVLREADAIGVKHYFIEDEGADPLRSIPQSLEYLRGL